MASTEKRKQSLYFADDMLGEIMKEANRLDRSLSWVMQRAWRIASKEVGKFPAAGHLGPAVEAAPGTAEGQPAPEPEARQASQPEPQADPRLRDFLRGKFDNTQAMTQH